MMADPVAVLAAREMDAMVAERVLGMKVLGWTTCVHVDGSWSIHPDSDVEGWNCYAERGPVWLHRCLCHLGEREPRHAAFGHGASCLEVIPNFSTDLAEAWSILNAISRCRTRDRKAHLTVRTECATENATGKRWSHAACKIVHPFAGAPGMPDSLEFFSAEMPDLPSAIVRAALDFAADHGGPITDLVDVWGEDGQPLFDGPCTCEIHCRNKCGQHCPPETPWCRCRCHAQQYLNESILWRGGT